MGIHTKTLMVTGSASVSGTLHFDGVLPSDVTVGSNSAADRKITFGHTNIPTSIGIDHNSNSANESVFAINTANSFSSPNDFEIDNTGNVSLAQDSLIVSASGPRVGIGTAAPDHMLHLKSTGQIGLKIEADTDDVTETDTAFIKLEQDAGQIGAVIGFCVAQGKDPENNNYTYATSNALLIGATAGSTNLHFGTNNIVRMTVADSTGVVSVPSGQFKVTGLTPTITIGDGDAEDTALVYNGNAQDYYIGLDDGTDSLIVGTGTTVGTNPSLTIDSNADVTLGENLVIGNAKAIKGVANTNINYNTNDGSGNFKVERGSGGTDTLVINSSGEITTFPSIGGTSPILTVGVGTNVKQGIVFNTDDSDFYIGTDINEHKSLILGVGNTIGSNDAMTITSGSLIRFASGSNKGGIYQSPAVQVSNSRSSTSRWIKIAETIESQNAPGQFRTNTAAFLVTFSSAASYDDEYLSPEAFIIYVHQANGQANNIDGESYVVVDKIGSQFQTHSTYHHWEATTDCFMVQYDGRKSQLWIKTNVNDAQVHVSMLGGTNGENENYVGIGWQICQGTGWEFSEPSLASWTKLYARWSSKDFDEVTVGGSLLCSGSLDVAGPVHLTRTTDGDATDQDVPALTIGSKSGQHLLFDTNEILSKSGGTTAATLYLQNNGGAGVSIGGGDTSYGGVVYKGKGDTINDGLSVYGNTSSNTTRIWTGADGKRHISGGANDRGTIYLNESASSSYTALVVGGKLGVGYKIVPQQSSYFPYCAFSAINQNTDSNIQKGVAVKVDFNNEVYDYGTNFSSDTFTAPIDGVYSLKTTVRLQSVSTDDPIYIRLTLVTSNRTYYRYFDTSEAATQSYTTFAIEADADMDSGDTAKVEVFIYHSTQTTSATDVIGSLSTISTYFSGHLIL